MTDKTWKQMSEEAIKSGYSPNGPWEAELKTHLRENFPKLVGELGDEFEDYCRVMTSNASDQFGLMCDQGTDPHFAWALAREGLLRIPDEKELREEADDSELADADQIGLSLWS